MRGVAVGGAGKVAATGRGVVRGKPLCSRGLIGSHGAEKSGRDAELDEVVAVPASGGGRSGGGLLGVARFLRVIRGRDGTRGRGSRSGNQWRRGGGDSSPCRLGLTGTSSLSVTGQFCW